MCNGTQKISKGEDITMKSKLYFCFFALVAIFGFTSNNMAQDISQWGLPDGAKARLGKGNIFGEIAYSPDGTKLAVASSIGIWIYDAQTGKELDLFTGHTCGMECSI